MNRIVVGIDRSPPSAAALRWAAERARPGAATLEVVHAYPAPLAYTGPEEFIADIDPELHEAMCDKMMALVADTEADLEGVDVRHRLQPGRASDGLLGAARGADLLVWWARGAPVASWASSSVRRRVAAFVLRRARWSWCRPPPDRGPVGSRSVWRGRPARSEPWPGRSTKHSEGAELEVVGVYHPYDEPGPYGATFMQIADPGATERFRRVAEEHVAKAIASLPPAVTVRSKVLAGPPAKVLVERTCDTDLLVLGRHGRDSQGTQHLGSVARQVLHHASSPVAIVPGPGTDGDG